MEMDMIMELAKVHNSLNTAHSTRNLGFIFDEHLTLSDQLHFSPTPATITYLNFAQLNSTSTSIQWQWYRL